MKAPPRKKGQGMAPATPSLYQDMAVRSRKTAKARAAVYMVEGESVNYAQMGERLGITASAAKQRFENERNKPGAVTWAGLKR